MLNSIVFAAALVATVSAYSRGVGLSDQSNAADVCSSRTPGHGFNPQTSTCPYDFVAFGWIPGEVTSSECHLVFLFLF